MKESNYASHKCQRLSNEVRTSQTNRMCGNLKIIQGKEYVKVDEVSKVQFRFGGVC